MATRAKDDAKEDEFFFWPSGSFFAGARRASEKKEPTGGPVGSVFFGGFLATNAFLAKSSSSRIRNTPSRVSAAARASAAAETFKRHKASCSFRLVSAAAARLRSAAAFARARSSLTSSVATRASASAARPLRAAAPA